MSNKKDMFGDDRAEQKEATDFASMFEQSLSTAGKKLSVGDKFKGEILSIGKESSYVATGTPMDASINTLDLKDETGALKHSVGETIDVVVSNCVLNLVEPGAKPQLFREIFRVLKLGGRAVISDIVADEDVPESLQNDPELWSGCISGALTEEAFLRAFEEAGFYGIEILKFDIEPWRTVEGIEFRSVTIQAFKGKQGACFERNQAVIYRGPFKEVLDDDGHRMQRGLRYAVCDKTYNLYKKSPYAESFDFLDPRTAIPASEAAPYDCSRAVLRHPKETKGHDYKATKQADTQCCDGGSCC
jgi:SAM-dependent methyltransferase